MAHNLPPALRIGPRGRAALAGLRELQQSPLTFLSRVTTQYGDLVRYPLGPWEFYIATHPDHVGRVLQENQRALMQTEQQKPDEETAACD